MNKAVVLAAVLSVLGGAAHGQYGGYRYNNFGQLVDGRGQLANVHQEMHDMQNSTLYTTGAVAVSNTVDPSFTQATLMQIEAAMAPTPEPGGQSMSRLYLTPTNPYTPGVGVQSGRPTGYNHDHYNQIMVDAPVGGYVPTQSGAYIAKTHPDSSSELYNRGFHTYEANPKFLAAKEAAGGQGGGIVFLVNQSAESYSHLRAISGSNVFMTGYARPASGGVVALRGEVVLNQQHNTNPALDTSRFGPAFVAGVSDYQGQTVVTGNEAGFWVSGTGNNTQISGWGNGSPDEIRAAYDPSAQFHVHTHPGNTGPSLQDMQASAILNGMPGMVVSNNGSFAYGFQVERGWLPTTDGGVVVFGNGYHDSTSGAGYGSTSADRGGNRGMNGIGHNIEGSRTVSANVGASAAFGLGLSGSSGGYVTFNPRGEIVGQGLASSTQVIAGAGIEAAAPSASYVRGIPTEGTFGTASLTVGTVFGGFSLGYDFGYGPDPGFNWQVTTPSPSLTANIGFGINTTESINNQGTENKNPLGLSTSDTPGHSGDVGGLW